MAQKHIIGSVTLQVRATRQADGFALQQDMSRWFWDEFLPVLDTVLTELAPQDQLIRLDKLDIVVPALPTVRWREDLTTVLSVALRERLERLAHYPSQIEAASLEQITVSQNHFEAWLFFLQTGQLPMHYAHVPEQERLTAVLEIVAANAPAVTTVLRLLHNNPTVLQRLVYQHDTFFLMQLAAAISGQKMAALPAWQQRLSGILSHPQLGGLVAAVLPNPKSPVTAQIAVRQFETRFWQDVYSLLTSESQSLDPYHFASSYFQTAFIRIFGIPFRDFLSKTTNLALKTPKIGRSSLQNLENTLRKIAGEEAFQTLFKPEIDAARSSVSGNTAQTIETDETGNITAKSDTSGPIELPETSSEANNKPGSILESSVAQTPAAETGRFVHEKKNPAEMPSLPSGTKPADQPIPELEEGWTTQKDTLLVQEAPSPGRNLDAQQSAKFPEPKTIFAEVAGLVLLHPFIVSLFEATGLLQQGLFADDNARMRGVHLLHYLAVGNNNDIPEYDLVLPKLLCGLPFHAPIDRQSLLSEAELREGDTMLQAAIKHWGALGAVSNDSLRQGFLQRDGKLSRRDDDWLLQVESKPHDVLLGRLPWGLGVVKFKWLHNIVHVEWY